MKIEYKLFEAEVKAFDDENLILSHFISTEHKDQGRDVMRAKGMRTIGRPVVLHLHGRGPMSSEPIAKPLSLTIDEFKGQPGILAKTQFYPDDTGQRLYQKNKDGYMVNWSIGYSVDESKDIYKDGRFDYRDVTKWTLHEYSPVGVGMNPFAQTVKDFLDKTEEPPKGPFEIPESHWFGLVDDKHPCPTCKGDLTLFVKDGNNIGIACEKCDPEKFAELTKAIAPPESETPMEKFKREAAALGITFPDPEGPTLKDLCNSIQIVADNVSRMGLEFITAKDSIEELRKSVEPLLSTLPPEPEGGDKGKGSKGNPPDGETPPLLVFRDSAKEAEEEERRKKAGRDQVAAAVTEAIRPIFKAQVDKILGKVP
jgi:hypothetical protein